MKKINTYSIQDTSQSNCIVLSITLNALQYITGGRNNPVQKLDVHVAYHVQFQLRDGSSPVKTELQLIGTPIQLLFTIGVKFHGENFPFL